MEGAEEKVWVAVFFLSAKGGGRRGGWGWGWGGTVPERFELKGSAAVD